MDSLCPGWGQAGPYWPTCHKKLSSTSRLSRSIGGSQGVSSTVGFSHGGDRQFSAAIAKGDLHAGQSGSWNHLAIPKPAHLRNWGTWKVSSHIYVGVDMVQPSVLSHHCKALHWPVKASWSGTLFSGSKDDSHHWEHLVVYIESYPFFMELGFGVHCSFTI